ncbi:MAG: ABC transporter ATP-binding protein [Actinomycetales bacterium]
MKDEKVARAALEPKLRGRRAAGRATAAKTPAPTPAVGPADGRDRASDTPAAASAPAAGQVGGPVLRAVGLHRSYGSGAGAVHACRDVSLDAHAGSLLVVRGPSGSGKTTLLNLLGGLDRPDAGTVRLDGEDLGAMGENQLIGLRRSRVGFVFQSFGLIPVLSAAENIEVPLRLQGLNAGARTARVAELLGLVGLATHGRQRPAELSGGQQQRVGLARALAGRPKVLIADEPTGQLDSVTASAMMDLMLDLVRHHGVAAIVSTHDPLMLSRADRLVELHDGVATAGTLPPGGGS